MTIVEIESTWKTTGFYCPHCKEDLYSDGEAAPTCMVCYHPIKMKDMISQMLELAPMDVDGYREFPE